MGNLKYICDVYSSQQQEMDLPIFLSGLAFRFWLCYLESF